LSRVAAPQVAHRRDPANGLLVGGATAVNLLAQAFFADSAAVQGVSATNGLKIVIP
jgi:hypothetical protein